MKAAADEMEYSSELLYDALIESTDDFIYMCNPKTGMFRYPELWWRCLAFPAK